MQRYFTNKLTNNIFSLSKEDMHHILNVMRMKENDMIEIVYQDNVYEGLITKEGVLRQQKISSKIDLPSITLIIPLLKESKMDLILQKATELGITTIIPLKTTRTIIKLNEGDFKKKKERWSKICKSASEQSKRTTIPIIENIKTIEELTFTGLKILCSTSETKNTLKNVLKNKSNYDRISIVVGPEGGLTKEEELKIEKQGFIPTSLGKLIMRVETVPIYILSVLNYEMME